MVTDRKRSAESREPQERFWARVALPDGRHAWELPISTVSSFESLVAAAAAQVLPRVTLVTVITHADMPSRGTLIVTMLRHPGGASAQIHCTSEDAVSGVVNAAGFVLLCDAAVSSEDAPDLIAPAPAVLAVPPQAEPESVRAGTDVSTESGGSDVPPRDAAERLVFATWAVVTGTAAKGIFATLPILDHDSAVKVAARLTDRVGGDITVDDVLDAETIEQLAETVRPHLEDGSKIDGLVRTLRGRAEGSTAVPVFVFHPAGGSTVAYEPLLKRLPAHTPMFGLERVEGPLAERAEAYLPLLRAIQGDGPYVLCGWSFGGALAYAVAKRLRRDGADVRLVGLIDTVLPGVKVENTPDEIRARWQRYAAFAKKTYHLDAPLPYDRLAAAGSDDEQIKILMDLLDASGTTIPAGIVEHQRTSWLDNRAVASTDLSETYDGNVVLYMAETYLDDQIALEPAFAVRQSDGGWGDAVENLEVVHVGCDHVQIVDEPYIGRVGADLASRLAAIDAALTTR